MPINTPPTFTEIDESTLYREYRRRNPTGMFFSPSNMRAFHTSILWCAHPGPSTRLSSAPLYFLRLDKRRSFTTHRLESLYTLSVVTPAGQVLNHPDHHLSAVTLTPITRILNRLLPTLPLTPHSEPVDDRSLAHAQYLFAVPPQAPQAPSPTPQV